eukprot:CAMPEP_0184861600 /NCGR_PEP_ID=MMETSP0580-20130426/6244_1 /TAXON_ID=1118495 /ORGANISM="Dactyliosolen fragilissimus" /LENGTH=737 /DNA_ID=CAMNT_0027359145 /DNA_START=578 /DNA_END=2791 /DNA_ORIENTATION=-
MKRDVMVVTADSELISRCKKSADQSKGGKMLSIINPLYFLEDFEQILDGESVKFCLQENIEERENDSDLNEKKEEYNLNGVDKNSNDESDDISSAMEWEIMMESKLIEINSQLRNNGKKSKNISPKKRMKLQKHANKIRAKLGSSGQNIVSQATSIVQNDGISTNSISLNFTEQQKLLENWKRIRETSGRRELTGDRVLLAEGLRRELDRIVASYSLELTNEFNYDDISPSEAHAHHANTLILDHSSQCLEEESKEMKGEKVASPLPAKIINLNEKDVLRIVVISDTHGYEEELTSGILEPSKYNSKDENSVETNPLTNKNLLPNGDILLHLGDFAIDRGGTARKQAIERFDKWLSLQPQHIKIVLRGNHDPMKVKFPKSKATYINKPADMKFGKKSFAFIPYKDRTYTTAKSQRIATLNLLPDTCNVLASHEPPSNMLDRCLSGERAGSRANRVAVESMKGPPPLLWLCGHIHEGRGSLKTNFSKKYDTKETLVMNAANANPGRASHLVNGPIVIDLSEDIRVINDGDCKPIDATKPRIKLNKYKKEDEEELLLAIDLGLKCGASLFDETGKLLRYEQLEFKESEALYAEAPLLIDDWESDVNKSAAINNSEQQLSKKKVISYLAIEGGGELLHAWESCIEEENKKHIQLVRIRPEEWRANLLLPNERKCGRSCKEAARLIARQIVSEFGVMDNHRGKFKTDVAESVAMGYYFAHHLGWIQKQPIISRYSNGKIIV